MLVLKLFANLKYLYINGKIFLNKKIDVEITRTILLKNILTYGNINGKIYHIEIKEALLWKV